MRTHLYKYLPPWPQGCIIRVQFPRHTPDETTMFLLQNGCIKAIFWFQGKPKNMRAMLDLPLLNVGMALHAFFKETAGTAPTRQLVQHNRHKGHLLWYLCGSQAQEDYLFYLTGYIACKYNRLLFLFGSLDIFSVWTQCSVLTLWFHWDCYTWDAGSGLPDCNWTCNTTNRDWWFITPGGTLIIGANPHTDRGNTSGNGKALM